MKRKRRLTMKTEREIIRLFNLKLSARNIALSCNISPTTASFYVNRFKSLDIDYDVFKLLTDEEIKAKLNPPAIIPKRVTSDMEYLNRELKRKGVTLYLLWEEYKSNNPDGYKYSQFAYYYRQWKKLLDPVMRINHKMGEKVFVDFSGYKPTIKNPDTGEIIEVELFVGVLGASNYTFAVAVYNQTLENWISCHVKMFEFFNAVPAVIVPDNLKSGITQACYYDPEINPTYLNMAEHYNIIILPARPNKPKDKPKAEQGVLSSQRRLIAPLRDKTFFSIEELNAAISKELQDYNDRPMQKINKSRYELFQEEKKYLRPLPERYELSYWKRSLVGIDYHVNVNNTYYSVPYQLVRKQVDICYDDNLVKIYHNSKIIASHKRSFAKLYFVTSKEHMSKSHQSVILTPERIKEESLLLGSNTKALIDKIIEEGKNTENALKMCIGIIRLNKKYSPLRVEAACKKALDFGLYGYRSVKNILNKNLENDILEEKSTNQIRHENIRGGIYYMEAK